MGIEDDDDEVEIVSLIISHLSTLKVLLFSGMGWDERERRSFYTFELEESY